VRPCHHDVDPKDDLSERVLYDPLYIPFCRALIGCSNDGDVSRILFGTVPNVLAGVSGSEIKWNGDSDWVSQNS
jgi:hypothetical protein